MVAGADTDRGASEGEDMLGKRLVHTVRDMVRILHREAAVDHKVQFRPNLLSNPASPRFVNSLDAPDVQRDEFEFQ